MSKRIRLPKSGFLVLAVTVAAVVALLDRIGLNFFSEL